MQTRTNVVLILLFLGALIFYDQALGGVLGDNIKSNCSFVNTGEISRNVTITVQCREALSELAHVFELIAEEYREKGRPLPHDTTEIVNA